MSGRLFCRLPSSGSKAAIFFTSRPDVTISQALGLEHSRPTSGGWKERGEQYNRRWVNGAFLHLIVGALVIGWGLVVMGVWL